MAQDFPLLRLALAPEYSKASYQELTGMVEAIYGPDVTPEHVEGLFDDIGRGLSNAGRAIGGFVQQAAPVVARALPNIAQGAASGAAFGPWGALAGAVAGGASGIMQQSNDPTVRDIGGAIHQVGSLASSIRGGGAGGLGGLLGGLGGRSGGAGGVLGALGNIGGGAAGQAPGAAGLLTSIFGGGGAGSGSPAGGGSAASGLMGMLSRPETLQGLLSAGMGAFGNRNLQIGGQQVPVHTLLSALGSLAGRAASEAAEYAENAEATPEFVTNASEALGINPESSEGRTDALLTLLALTPSIWAASRTVGPPLTVNVTQPDPGQFVPVASQIGREAYEFADTNEAWPEWPVWPDWGDQEAFGTEMDYA